MTRPNMILILADDMGYWTLGSSGNQDARTPNLDRMAREGCRMENFFCASPVCSPARATLMTGKMPSTHGVLDWISGGNVETAGEKGIEYLKEFPCYTDYLSSSGYICGLSGKWHLGSAEKPQKGFSHWYAHQSGGGPYFDPPMVRDGKTVREKGYVTELITEDALGFIEEAHKSGSPFYLSVHYTAPHTPWIGNHPAKYLDLYKDCRFGSCPVEERHPWQIDFQDFNDPREEMLRGYFAAASAMDEGVGRIRSLLARLGIERETLVIFSSDNGFNCGHHGVWGKGNGTYPANMYDSSVKVPMIACWPGTIPEGRRLTGLYSACDFFPTVIEIGEISFDASAFPGKSFAGIWKGQCADRTEGDIAVFDEYGGVRMLRQKRWKYVCRYPAGPNELYDLEADPQERENLIDKAPEQLIKLLHNRLEEWFYYQTRPETDGRTAGVTGAGQRKMHTPYGFEPGSFEEKY